MNTSKLQAFATDARRQLMNAVQARLDAALVPNSDAQVDDPRAFDFLQREIGQAGGGVEGRRHVDDFLDAYRRELIAAIENGKKILL